MIEILKTALRIFVLIICAPFRLIAALGRTSVAFGGWLFTASINMIIGLFGIGFVVFFFYGMARVMFHPLFHK